MGFRSGKTETGVPGPLRPFPFRNWFPVCDEGVG